MSALFGVLGSPRLLDAVSSAMPVATRHREIRDADAVVIGRLGLAQSADYFPHAEAVVTPAGTVAALRGYAWDHWGFPTTHAAAVELVSAMADRLVTDGRLAVDGAGLSGLFSLVAITRTHVHAVTDPSGLYPLYLLANRDGIAVSSHSRPLGRAAGSGADLHGALQTAAFGYSIGSRTLFNDVTRLPAGAAVSIERANGRMTFVEQSAAYGKLVDYASRDEAADAVWHDYTTGLSELTRVPGCAGMLMSGGFDTRMVAMGLAESHRPITALTLGDPGNYEVRIAERVARLTGAQWRQRTAQQDLDTLASRLPRLIAESESANFPTCDSGGEELVADGATTLSTGYGGETIIGGQGSAQFLANTRTKRLWSVMRRSLSRMDRPALTNAAVQDLITAMHAFHAVMLRQLGNRIAPDLRPRSSSPGRRCARRSRERSIGCCSPVRRRSRNWRSGSGASITSAGISGGRSSRSTCTRRSRFRPSTPRFSCGPLTSIRSGRPIMASFPHGPPSLGPVRAHPHLECAHRTLQSSAADLGRARGAVDGDERQSTRQCGRRGRRGSASDGAITRSGRASRRFSMNFLALWTTASSRASGSPGRSRSSAHGRRSSTPGRIT